MAKSQNALQFPNLSFKHTDVLTRDKVARLSDSDLLILAQQKKVVRLEGFEVCFKGIRYSYLCKFPVAISNDTRVDIIEELLDNQF